MTRSVKKTAHARTISLALTWDGARWPTRLLPPPARSFLRNHAAPSARELSALFSADEIDELRICWVPKLKGGEPSLSEPFQTPSGQRLPFRSVATVPFGDVLGVVYRKNSNSITPPNRKTQSGTSC